MDHAPTHVVELTFEPKTYDIDFAGIVSNLVYVRWMEDLRLAFLERYCPLSRLLPDGLAPILRATRVRYHAPVQLLDTLVGRMWASGIGRVTWEVACEFTRIADQTTVATGTQEGLFIELSNGKPARMPHELRELLPVEHAPAGATASGLDMRGIR